MTSTADEEQGLALGAADFITNPINQPNVLARVATQLQAKAGADFLRNQNQFLEADVQKRARQITAIRDVTILAMALACRKHATNETGNHIRRTQNYVRALALALRDRLPPFREQISDHTIVMLFKSAPLHDNGKIGIPDRILLGNRVALKPHEFEIMKRHTTRWAAMRFSMLRTCSACPWSSCNVPRRSPTDHPRKVGRQRLSARHIWRSDPTVGQDHGSRRRSMTH